MALRPRPKSFLTHFRSIWTRWLIAPRLSFERTRTTGDGSESEVEEESEGPLPGEEEPTGRHVMEPALDSAATTSSPCRALKRKRTDFDGDELTVDDSLDDDDVRPPPVTHGPLPSSSRLLSPAHPTSEPKQLDRQRLRRRKKRKIERKDEQAALGSNTKGFCAKRTSSAIRKRVEIDLDSSAAQEPVASSGFVCLNDSTLNGRRENATKKAAKKTKNAVGGSQPHPPPAVLLPTTGKFTKEQMGTMGMTVDNWDGKSQVVYTDRQGRELVILCGQPRDTATSNWGRDVAEAGFQLMLDLAPKLSPLEVDAAGEGKKRRKRKKKRNLRRGDHRAETVGVGIGNGRKGPRNFHNDDDDAAVLNTLLASAPFTRIAGFSNSILFNFAPRLHEYYQKTMDALFDWDPRLRRIFQRGTSVFPSCTFNFGPQTVTVPHLDLLNLAWGWCFITAFGNFDPNKGGHLILWDLKRVIRFPPGATIAIPSALLRHSNVSIQQGETRYSFTQFAAGGLFRFVENNFQLNESLAEQVAHMSEVERSAFIEARAMRFSEGLKMYQVHSETQE
ncbi:hypothetical protein HMN09_00288800 [Mycena chlorophos]|uniref:Uncharacterized protein n=1 Tax=Mycena chlorophos TaxID=658473 RepID=A0A8H6TIQ4_MYCCL|nr:hypothetical protein HMN09_00288800 [Mycena chlorophos]